MKVSNTSKKFVDYVFWWSDVVLAEVSAIIGLNGNQMFVNFM